MPKKPTYEDLEKIILELESRLKDSNKTQAQKKADLKKSQIQEELMKRNQFIESVLEYLPIGLGVNYIDTGDVTYLNKKFEEIYGWPKEDFPNVADFFEKVFPDPEAREILQEIIIADIASGDPARMAWEDLEITTKKGEKRVVYAKNIPIPDQNLMISTVQNVTERRKLEAQIKQAQKMESIGRLAGGVAHDFNNMLSIISGNTEMVIEDMDPQNPQRSNLVEIQKAVRRSTALISQLLAFARKQTVAPETIALNATIDDMLKMLKRLIGEDIDLAWQPDSKLWPIKMDPFQVDQILANLCVNARDAIKGVGKITIETGNKVFDDDYCALHEGFQPGEFVMVAVSDNGCGMPRDIMGKVFEPFFTTKEPGEGTGLGLSMVYGVVKQNKGFVNVYSELEKGTTLKLYFPRKAAVTKLDRTTPRTSDTVGGKETVLVVEDEEAILKMLKVILKRLGYQVLSATGAKQAMQIAQTYKDCIHLLMTDVVMPDMSGKDLSEKLLSRYPDMKCLFMSGYTADVIAHHGVLDEGIQFINKPFSMQEVADKVRETIDQDGKSK